MVLMLLKPGAFFLKTDLKVPAIYLRVLTSRLLILLNLPQSSRSQPRLLGTVCEYFSLTSFQKPTDRLKSIWSDPVNTDLAQSTRKDRPTHVTLFRPPETDRLGVDLFPTRSRSPVSARPLLFLSSRVSAIVFAGLDESFSCELCISCMYLHQRVGSTLPDGAYEVVPRVEVKEEQPQ
jgi:hypothetical protein